MHQQLDASWPALCYSIRAVLTSSLLPPAQHPDLFVRAAGDEGATAVAHVLKDMRNLQVLAKLQTFVTDAWLFLCVFEALLQEMLDRDSSGTELART